MTDPYPMIDPYLSCRNSPVRNSMTILHSHFGLYVGLFIHFHGMPIE